MMPFLCLCSCWGKPMRLIQHPDTQHPDTGSYLTPGNCCSHAEDGGKKKKILHTQKDYLASEISNIN